MTDSIRKRIGVFDSGLGGLTVVRALQAHLDGIEIIYVADTAHAPYGEKSTDQIRHYSDAITRYLIDTHRIDALVVACNTATSAAIAHLRDTFADLVIVGTEPGIKPAMQRTHSGKVGILATPATLRGDKYQALADRLYNGTDLELFEQACPGLVEQIEAGRIDTPRTEAMLERWLAPMREAGVDTIVLGCTHYPLAAKAIERVMGRLVELIETGEAIAQRLKSLIDFSPRGGAQTLELYATGTIDERAVKQILECENVSIKTIKDIS